MRSNKWLKHYFVTEILEYAEKIRKTFILFFSYFIWVIHFSIVVISHDFSHYFRSKLIFYSRSAFSIFSFFFPKMSVNENDAVEYIYVYSIFRIRREKRFVILKYSELYFYEKLMVCIYGKTMNNLIAIQNSNLVYESDKANQNV